LRGRLLGFIWAEVVRYVSRADSLRTPVLPPTVRSQLYNCQSDQLDDLTPGKYSVYRYRYREANQGDGPKRWSVEYDMPMIGHISQFDVVSITTNIPTMFIVLVVRSLSMLLLFS
jgi:hypothetical protein